MNHPMNTAEFTDQRQEMAVNEAVIELGTYPENFQEGAEAVVVYPGDLYITRHPEVDCQLDLSAPFKKDVRTGHREYLEPILYFNWYVSKCVKPEAWTSEALSVLLEEYCDWQRLPVGAQLNTRENLSPDQRVWLRWFDALSTATSETLH